MRRNKLVAAALGLSLLVIFCGRPLAQVITGGVGAAVAAVTSIATTSPISGGTITTTGTISCPTCVTASGALVSGGIVVGGTGLAVATTQSPTVTGTVTAAAFATSGAASGTLGLSGSSSGTVTQTVQAAAGTPTVTWGTSSGTPAVTATLPLAITSATGNIALPATMKSRGIVFEIGDPGGSALASGSTTSAYVTVPFTCTLAAWNLLVDAGTISVKFWKVASGTAIPTSSNSLNPGNLQITTATASRSATNGSEWSSTAVTQNDIMAMNVTAVATAKYVSGTLQCDQ